MYAGDGRIRVCLNVEYMRCIKQKLYAGDCIIKIWFNSNSAIILGSTTTCVEFSHHIHGQCHLISVSIEIETCGGFATLISVQITINLPIYTYIVSQLSRRLF